MKKGILLALGLVMVSLAIPFGLDKQKKYPRSEIPQVEGFKYYFGDVEYGKIVYLGTKDLSGYETELQVVFGETDKVQSALLVLGPTGIDESNCIVKYKEVVSQLSAKYGSYTYLKEVKDPIIKDLIGPPCAPVRVGIHEVDTMWKLEDMIISAKLVGDDFGFYIEIEYIFNNNRRPSELSKFL